MTNIIFAGVGGQGVILSGRILMDVALRAGYDVKESEIHGMAQRGGSVDCHVRFGDQVHSPLIPAGRADIVVGLELLEAVRKLDTLAPGGLLIADLRQINPVPVQSGQMEYPTDLADWIRCHLPHHCLVETEGTLKGLGSTKVLNLVLLGLLSVFLEFDRELWYQSIAAVVKEKHVALNLNAFEQGRALAGPYTVSSQQGIR